MEHCVQDNASRCRHEFIEYFQSSDKFRCIDCVEELNDAQGIAIERAKMNALIDLNPGISGKRSHERGVSIRFLMDFTNENNCWEQKTRYVRRHFVMSATKETRCRYTELPHMCHGGKVGPATIFISHAWDSIWGDVVRAICHGQSNHNLFVWIDLFAIRQWPAKVADLNFRAVVENCDSFLMFCPMIPEVDELKHTNATLIPRDIRKCIPIFRIWCIVELHAAITANINIVIRCGKFDIAKNKFAVSSNTLQKFAMMLFDVRYTDATDIHDKKFILDQIENGIGVNKFNHIVRSFISGAAIVSEFLNSSLVQCAALGDHDAFERILMDSTSPHVASAGGYHRLLQKMVGRRLDVHSVDSESGFSPLLYAARCGNYKCLDILLYNCHYDYTEIVLALLIVCIESFSNAGHWKIFKRLISYSHRFLYQGGFVFEIGIVALKVSATLHFMNWSTFYFIGMIHYERIGAILKTTIVGKSPGSIFLLTSSYYFYFCYKIYQTLSSTHICKATAEFILQDRYVMYLILVVLIHIL